MIRLIQNPYGYYLYDARVNKIAQITEELYRAYQSKDLKKLEKLPEYQHMCQEGFFNEKDFNIELIDDEILRNIYCRSLNYIVLQVTQNCNFRCSYCPYTTNNGNNRLHSDKTMSVNMALRAIDFLHDHSVDAERINIGFYGGEPLIAFPLIKTVIEYAKEKFEGKALGFHITTNATLLSKEIMEYFEHNPVALTVSLDGPKEINDANRIFAQSAMSTFDIVIGKLAEIAEKYPDLKKRTSINMVVVPSMEYSEYLSLFQNPVIAENYAVNAQLVDSSGLDHTYDATEQFIAEYRYHHFIDALWEQDRVKIEPYYSLFGYGSKSNWKQRYNALELPAISDSGYPSGPCIPGYRKIFINVDGKMFPCEKVSEINSAMNMGDIDNGIDLEQCSALLNMPRITEKECKQCWAFRFCDACYVHACDADGLSREARLKYCNTAKLSADNNLRRYIIENRHNVEKY